MTPARFEMSPERLRRAASADDHVPADARRHDALRRATINAIEAWDAYRRLDGGADKYRALRDAMTKLGRERMTADANAAATATPIPPDAARLLDPRRHDELRQAALAAVEAWADYHKCGRSVEQYKRLRGAIAELQKAAL
jgi:hypothetical protein